MVPGLYLSSSVWNQAFPQCAELRIKTQALAFDPNARKKIKVNTVRRNNEHWIPRGF